MLAPGLLPLGTVTGFPTTRVPGGEIDVFPVAERLALPESKRQGDDPGRSIRDAPEHALWIWGITDSPLLPGT